MDGFFRGLGSGGAGAGGAEAGCRCGSGCGGSVDNDGEVEGDGIRTKNDIKTDVEIKAKLNPNPNPNANPNTTPNLPELAAQSLKSLDEAYEPHYPNPNFTPSAELAAQSLIPNPNPNSTPNSNLTTSAELAAQSLKNLDEAYQALTLNHITRRSSAAQGVALMGLLTRGFVRPDLGDERAGSLSGNANVPHPDEQDNREGEGDEDDDGEGTSPPWWSPVIEGYKTLIRKGETMGHLPVCWGVLTRCMGLDRGE